MSSIGFGDLAASYQGSIQNTKLKVEMSRLGQELSTGKRTDVKSETGNELTKYAGIRNAITSLGAYRFASQDAALLTETAQTSLGVVRDLTSDFAPSLLTYGTTATEPGLGAVAQDGLKRFQSVVSALNTRVAERSLFSGLSVDRNPLADTETMLADLNVAIAAETTAAGVETVVEAWFDDVGGGFETIGYLGSTTDLAPLAIAQNESAEFDVRADNQGIRDILKGYAMVALVAEGALSGDLTQRSALLQAAGERLFQSNQEIGNMQARLGVTERQIEIARTKNTAETSALEMAEAAIVAADPYRTATELRAAETQLESLFAVTARLSRLSLVNYLS